MVISRNARPAESLLNRNEQSTINFVPRHSLPASATPLSALKPLEGNLHKKGILKHPSDPTYPLWFLAEMERNVFLWRHGLSLSDQDRFEFWIDVPALIVKRKLQLTLGSPENPFINKDWIEEQHQDKHGSKHELEYLESFEAQFGAIQLHAHALCVAAMEVAESLLAQPSSPIILLPNFRLKMPVAEALG